MVEWKLSYTQREKESMKWDIKRAQWKKGNQDKKSGRGKYILTAGNDTRWHEKKQNKSVERGGRTKSQN